MDELEEAAGIKVLAKIILQLTAHLKRDVSDDEVIEFVMGDEATRERIWNS